MKVAVYGRVSTEEQAEKGSIQNQIEFATKYCDLHQLEIFEIYKDDGISGTVPLHERPEGKRLIQDAKDKKFDTLLLYKLDRLGRSARVTLNSIYELENYGVQIKSMTEPFDTSNPSGRFMITMLAGVADLERETILERMWHGANRAARSGKWLGGIVPYGYKVNDNGFLEVNVSLIPGFHMSEAEVVRLIYSLLVDQHYSTVKIADYLNALGVPPAYIKDGRQIKKGTRKENTAGIWRPARIRGIVTNTVYKGVHFYGRRSNKQRELIEREVPALISESVCNKAQEVLKSNQIEAFKNSNRNYLLRGLIKCGSCGCTYHGTGFAGAKREIKYYYLCGGKAKYNGPKLGKCTSKNIAAEQIEEMIWDDIVNFINNPGDVLEQLDKSMDDKKALYSTLLEEKKVIQNSLDEKEHEKQSILDLFRKKLIDAADVEKQFSKIAEERIALENRIKSINVQLNSQNDLSVQYNTAAELLKNLREKIRGNINYEKKREIVKILVKEVLVTTLPSTTPGGRPRATITANYNFAKELVHTDKDSY
jgi:site-specific DNA recombinase